MTHTFTYSGPGTVTCHGTPPLALRVDETEYPCPDPAAEWCRFQPEWELGTHRMICVNGSGVSEARVVEVPEVVGFLVPFFLCVVALLALWALWSNRA